MITIDYFTRRLACYKQEFYMTIFYNNEFNEEHYFFWLKQLEKVAKSFILKTKIKPTLKELNDYFKERGTWGDVDGIQFQDLPTNVNHLLVKPIEYRKGKRWKR